MDKSKEQIVAEAQIEMMRIFKMTIYFVLALMTFSVYDGWSSDRDTVKKSRYERDRKEDKEERRRMNNKIERILNSVNETRKDISVINERLKKNRD